MPCGVDRLTSAALVEALLALEDSLWHDWRGLRDDRPARKLSQSELARLLRPFSIRPHVIWPANRMPGDKSFRGLPAIEIRVGVGRLLFLACHTVTR